MHYAWIATGLFALVITISGCPKKEAPVDPTTGNTGSIADNQPFADDENSGFIPEPIEQPLADSPFNLWGFSLGTRLDPHNAEYGDSELELSQNWREGELTGIQWRKLLAESDDAEPARDISYFHDGELVGSQRMVEQSETDFVTKVDVLTTKYGDPVTAVPMFLRDSLIYGDLTADNPSQFVLWIDEDTRTAIAGRYDNSDSTGMWLLFHPERFDAAQGDTFAGAAS